MNAIEPIAEDCWFLTGPTASGKSAIATVLAAKLDAEIVSLDSMALYRGMDIGTAKPTHSEREATPHHLIDVIDPADEYSLAEYIAAAHRTVAEIRSRGKRPLFVGGTALYLKALLRGLSAGRPADWKLRTRLQEYGRDAGAEALHARLARVDPLSARRLHPRDTRRVIRALEVWESTGQSITQMQQQFDRARTADACHAFVLQWPREHLYARIDKRVDAMFADGLVDEVRGLMQAARPLGRTASQAVGYREVIDLLRGVRNLEETVALVKTRTRRFAKRQLTWFRSLSECREIAMTEPIRPDQITQRIIEARSA